MVNFLDKSMKEKIKIILLILVVVAILLGLGFWSWINYQEFRLERCKAVCGESRGCNQDCINFYRDDFPE